MAVTDDAQQWYQQGGKFKQQLDEIVNIARGGVEHEPESTTIEKPIEVMEEVPTEPELEKKPELAGYIEQVEKATELATPVVDDYTQQVLMKSPDMQKQEVKLPLTEEQIQSGLHHKVWESIRWLAEWCFRQLKLLRGRSFLL
jgi:hypothetical protein